MKPPHAALDATSGNPGSPRTTKDDLTDGSRKERRTRKHRNQRVSEATIQPQPAEEYCLLSCGRKGEIEELYALDAAQTIKHNKKR
ncbi:hypothetical protein NDU88_005403 [Pleurodeles waltl]|uniref:Uncharacterized protein n=1 Tax=Pleurodeles waltl TaxID=8319 RepID=A0AAV7TCF9_PLEWA|nr:hypothetical protein NDU88_005403 [Pleurodeles waltl]